jgi:RNA polymerase sigma factor (sigma-70 family)
MSANDTSPAPLSPGLSDEELMRELAAGRPEAIDQLHARYASLIYGMAARSLDRPGAEETSQEVFLSVWRHAATFDPTRGTFRAWVLQITRRSVLNELRRRGRRPRAAAQSDGSSGDHLPDPGDDPAESVWREHRRAVVREAVQALPPEELQVTLERIGARAGAGAVPTAPPVLRWPAQ